MEGTRGPRKALNDNKIIRKGSLTKYDGCVNSSLKRYLISRVAVLKKTK